MPQPGYNAAGQAQGRVDRWGNYRANNPTNLGRLFGGILGRGNAGGAPTPTPSPTPMPAQQPPRNPADIAPPGYTQEEWDAMSSTPRIVVHGQGVGGGGGGAPGGGWASWANSPARAAYLQRRGEDLGIMSSQAWGGDTGIQGVSDEGHTVFATGPQARFRGRMEEGAITHMPTSYGRPEQSQGYGGSLADPNVIARLRRQSVSNTSAGYAMPPMSAGGMPAYGPDPYRNPAPNFGAYGSQLFGGGGN